jgi:hypothetical protein
MSLLRTQLLVLSLGWCGLCNAQTEPEAFVLPAGTRIPLTLVNSLSSKTAKIGDLVFFKTVFPVASGNRIVIPVGSGVMGEITKLQRPGRIRGKGEIAIRFTKLTLPSGVERTFPASLSGLDGSNPGKKSEQGTVRAASGGEAEKVGGGAVQIAAETTAQDAIDAGPYAVAEGVVVGAAAAALGTGLSLISRGPDVNLPRGTHMEISITEDISFGPEALQDPR